MAALDTPWKNEAGEEIRLSSLFNKNRPVILVPVYYTCPMLCQVILKGLAKGLNQMEMSSEGVFDIVAFSIAPDDTPAGAAERKELFLKDYTQHRQTGAISFLSGSETAIKTLTNSIGFKYEKDPTSGEYIHSAVLVFLSPEGKIMRYMGGIEFDARSVKLGLIEAANGKVGSFWDQILLICYHYNPQKGKYSMAVDRILQITGTLTALGVFGFIFFSLRSEKIGRKPSV
jgi:protein SCO1/2